MRSGEMCSAEDESNGCQWNISISFVLEMYRFWSKSSDRWHDFTGLACDVFSLSFLSADAFCSSSVTSWRSPTFDHVRGHSRAFEACFKLPATCIWTQAAKASLGRHRHTYNPRGSAASSREETPGCDHTGSAVSLVIFTFFWFFRAFKPICSETVSNILLALINKHAEFTACNHGFHVVELSGDSAEQTATFLITGTTVGQRSKPSGHFYCRWRLFMHVLWNMSGQTLRGFLKMFELSTVLKKLCSRDLYRLLTTWTYAFVTEDRESKEPSWKNWMSCVGPPCSELLSVVIHHQSLSGVF